MSQTRRVPAIDFEGRLPGLRRVAQRARAVTRALALIAWTLPSLAVQSVLLALPGRGKRVFARVFWAVFAWLLGVRVRVMGTPAAGGRPVLYVANHTSWLDIPALGGQLEACFVAKSEVGEWPLIRTVARLGRTVFVSRRARDAGRERDDMRARFAGGDNLLLFPEGTSSDGARVLPFRSAFFSVAEAASGEAGPVIQPVSIVYDRLDGLPVPRPLRVATSWYGDMELGSHFWALAQYRRVRATILLHRPVDPAAAPSRKALAQRTWDVIAAGAAALRQNREWAEPATRDSLDLTPSTNATVEAPSVLGRP